MDAQRAAQMKKYGQIAALCLPKALSCTVTSITAEMKPHRAFLLMENECILIYPIQMKPKLVRTLF